MLIGIVTIRVSRQELAGAVPEPQEAAPQPGTLQRHDDRAALQHHNEFAADVRALLAEAG